NSSVFYRFNGINGDSLTFDNISVTPSTSAAWILISPYNEVVDLGVLNADNTIRLNHTGVWMLIVQGTVGETVPNSYSFRVSWNDFISPPTAPGISTNLGDTVSSDISVPLEEDFYAFTRSSTTRLWLDSMTEDGFNASWSLRGPQGVVRSNWSFSNDDYSLGLLPAGTYTLRVSASNAGNYSFRLLDLASATPLPTVPETLSPSNSTNLHQFSGTQGQIVYFDNTSFSTTDTTGNAGGSLWFLFDQYGTQLFGQGIGNDGGRVVLPNTGTYTIVVQGSLYADGTTTYAFDAIPVTDDSVALTFGTTYSSSISTLGQQDNYTFTLSSPTRLWFDSMTEDGFNASWS
ncbi:MAG: hypothetical protein ACK58T_28445, partial [Phycisphaerae bacterium]